MRVRNLLDRTKETMGGLIDARSRQLDPTANMAPAKTRPGYRQPEQSHRLRYWHSN